MASQSQETREFIRSNSGVSVFGQLSATWNSLRQLAVWPRRFKPLRKLEHEVWQSLETVEAGSLTLSRLIVPDDYIDDTPHVTCFFGAASLYFVVSRRVAISRKNGTALRSHRVCLNVYLWIHNRR